MYDTSETVLLLSPLFKDVFWLNLSSIDTIIITDASLNDGDTL